MKKSIIFMLLVLFPAASYAQDYSSEKTALTNFLKRMYENAPFEGVRVVDDYDNTYLLSVLSLDVSKYTNESAMNRVASVKAMSQASRFFNGSNITADLIIRTSEKSDGSGDTEMIETIKENSVGYVKTLEQLTNFKGKDNWQVFMFYKKIDAPNK